MSEWNGRKANDTVAHWGQRGASKHQQYFTPAPIAEWMAAAIHEWSNKSKDLRVLDPTAGSGRLLAPFKKLKGTRTIGVELDSLACKHLARVIGPKSVRNGSIQEYSTLLDERFNVVVANPPFNLRFENNLDPNGPNRLLSEEYVLRVAHEALIFNGILAWISPVFDGRDQRMTDFFENKFKHLGTLKAEKMFKDEYGIDVECDVTFWTKSHYNRYNTVRPFEVEWNEAMPPEIPRIRGYGSNMEYPKVHLLDRDVPNLDRFPEIDTETKVSINPKGVSGGAVWKAQVAGLELLKDYNPVLMTETGYYSAHLGGYAVVERGPDHVREIMEKLGHADVEVENEAKLKRATAANERLRCPLTQPNKHQWYAYYALGEYECKEGVETESGHVLKEGETYHIKPKWSREAYHHRDEEVEKTSKGEAYLELQHFYRSTSHMYFEVTGKDGKVMNFHENKEDQANAIKKAFPLKDVMDIANRYPEAYELHYDRVEKVSSKLKLPLKEYQKDDIARKLFRQRTGFFFEQAGGKTITSICWAIVKRYKRILVVAPPGLVQNWVSELEKFGIASQTLLSWEDVRKYKESGRPAGIYISSYTFLRNGKKKKLWGTKTCGHVIRPAWSKIAKKLHNDFAAARANEKKTDEPLDPVEITKYYESIQYAEDRAVCGHDLAGGICPECGWTPPETTYHVDQKRSQYPGYKRMAKLFSCLIVDEAHKTNKRSLQGGAVRSFNTNGAAILTGTPMRGYVEELYQNLRWLLGSNNPRFPYSKPGQFQDEFCTYEWKTDDHEETNQGPRKVVPQVGNLNRLWRLLGTFSTRLTFDQILKAVKMKLPKHRHIVPVTLDADHAALYKVYEGWAKNMLREAISCKEPSKRMGMISSALWKMRRACSTPTNNVGFKDANDKAPRLWLRKGHADAKLKKLKELVDNWRSLGDKGVIFSGLAYKQHEIKAYLEKQGINVLFITAKTPPAKRSGLVRSFINDDNDVIVTGLEVLNEGFNITAANHVAFLDIDWSPATQMQAEARVRRIGQEKVCHYWWIVANNTIDTTMLGLVQEKWDAITRAIDGENVYQADKHFKSIMDEVADRILAGESTEADGMDLTKFISETVLEQKPTERKTMSYEERWAGALAVADELEREEGNVEVSMPEPERKKVEVLPAKPNDKLITELDKLFGSM